MSMLVNFIQSTPGARLAELFAPMATIAQWVKEDQQSHQAAQSQTYPQVSQRLIDALLKPVTPYDWAIRNYFDQHLAAYTEPSFETIHHGKLGLKHISTIDILRFIRQINAQGMRYTLTPPVGGVVTDPCSIYNAMPEFTYGKPGLVRKKVKFLQDSFFITSLFEEAAPWGLRILQYYDATNPSSQSLGPLLGF